MKEIRLQENETATIEIIDGVAVIIVEEKKKEFKGKLMEDEPTIEEVRERFPAGTRFKRNDSSSVYEVLGVYTMAKDKEAYYASCSDINHKDNFLNVVLWSKLGGWSEIIEPIFTNSHGTKFYEGGKGYYVNKNNLVLSGEHTLPNYLPHEESGMFTEIMTKEQAEQYVLEHRVFEDKAHYKAVYKNESTCAWYSSHFSHFYLNTHEEIVKRTDFDSIGEKIEF